MRVARAAITTASTASAPSRGHTADQSGEPSSVSRLATTAQSSGFQRAKPAIHAGASDGSMIAEDRNVMGRLRNWLIPISASCWRAISAIAFDSAAQITVSRHADTSVTTTPVAPPAKRAPASSATTRTITVCTTLVTDW